MLEQINDVVERLVAFWRPDGASDAEVRDMTKLALSQVASGYLTHVYTDASRPVFLPLWNYAMNQGGPNPDYVYRTAQVDPSGVYRISGYRGTSRFVEITQQAKPYLIAAMLTGPRDDGPPLRTTNDLNELTIGPDGYFSVLLSTERPDGHDGDWWPLDPRARALLMRKCACDWRHEVDPSVAIERLDDPGADMTPDEITRRIGEIEAFVEGVIEFDMRLVRYYREHHGINVLTKSQWIEDAGGLAKQAYYDGIHQIADDEALIVEVPLPQECFYWQILVADDRFSTVDWVNRQSSLNDVQAVVDADGVLRVVVSKQDPGVHNWLDKADFPWGILQMRLYRASSHPDTSVTKVPVAEVLKHLPDGTTVLTPEERREQLRGRREGAQLRRLW